MKNPYSNLLCLDQQIESKFPRRRDYRAISNGLHSPQLRKAFLDICSSKALHPEWVWKPSEDWAIFLRVGRGSPSAPMACAHGNDRAPGRGLATFSWGFAFRGARTEARVRR